MAIQKDFEICSRNAKQILNCMKKLREVNNWSENNCVVKDEAGLTAQDGADCVNALIGSLVELVERLGSTQPSEKLLFIWLSITRTNLTFRRPYPVWKRTFVVDRVHQKPSSEINSF